MDLFGHWRRIRTRLARPNADDNGVPGRPFGGEPPLRAELFSTAQMEQHGAWLASARWWMPPARDRGVAASITINNWVAYGASGNVSYEQNSLSRSSAVSTSSSIAVMVVYLSAVELAKQGSTDGPHRPAS